MVDIVGTNDGDILNGTTGDDWIRGLGGNDVIDGLGGADLLEGGTGDDIFYVDDAGDQIVEQSGEGSDEVRASISHTLAANVENLTLTGLSAINGTGNALNNQISGNDAANIIRGGGGSDTFLGGGGDDYYIIEADVVVSDGNYSFSGIDQIVEAADGGNDTVATNAGGSLAANVENMILTGSLNLGAVGNELDNRLIGNDGNNSLQGGAGNDYLDGGAGADLLRGGAGNDTYVVDSEDDAIAGEAPAGAGGPDSPGGIDTVLSSVNYTLGLFLENLTLLGTAAINGTGNTLDNVIVGNELANRLTGDAGNDLLQGGGGDDVIDAGVGVDTLYGGSGNDDLAGLGGSDYLDGGTGADIMAGGFDDDIYVVDNAADQIIEVAGQGSDRVYALVSYTLASGTDVEILAAGGGDPNAAINLVGNALANNIWGNAGSNLLNGAQGNDALFGFGGNDNLFGGDGNNFLVGGEGSDNLFGGSGVDILLGEAGADSFLFFTAVDGANVDVIADFTAEDLLVLDDAIFSGLAPGALAAGAFVVGAAAQDADDRIIYDQTTGALLFDPDGSGAAAAIQFATVNNAPILTAADFLII